MSKPNFTLRRNGLRMATLRLKLTFTEEEWRQLEAVTAAEDTTPRDYLDMHLTNLQIRISDEYYALTTGATEEEDEES